jgi:hypothetical protein
MSYLAAMPGTPQTVTLKVSQAAGGDPYGNDSTVRMMQRVRRKQGWQSPHEGCSVQASTGRKQRRGFAVSDRAVVSTADAPHLCVHGMQQFV